MRRLAQGRRRLFVLLAAVVLLFAAATTRPVLRLVFPIRYASLIAQAGADYRLEPHLIAALIRVESSFDPRARSAKGAIGLMQLMPETAEWIALKKGVSLTEARAQELEDPRLNIDYGSWYLRTLLDDFRGDIVLALAAYNSGWGNVRGWLAKDVWSGRPDEVDQIPFPETRAYVRRVLATWKWYERLYPEFPTR